MRITTINWDDGSLEKSPEESRAYFLEYLGSVKDAGAWVYLIEYTKNENLAKEIIRECDKLNYTVYVSDDIDLD